MRHSGARYHRVEMYYVYGSLEKKSTIKQKKTFTRAKVSKFHCPLTQHQNILRFNITMKDAFPMYMLHSGQQVKNNIFYSLQR